MTADVVSLYPSRPHHASLEALKDVLDCKQNKKIPIDMLVKIADFVLTNNYFAFGQKLFHQISGTAICTKFAPPYVYIFMDNFETDFLRMQKLQPFVLYRCRAK